MKVREHSDMANTDDPSQETAGLRRPKHTPVFQVCERTGFVYGKVTWRAPEDGQGEKFIQAMHRLHRVQEVPEIVMPTPDWPVDSEGRGLSVLEHLGPEYLSLEQRRIRQHVRALQGIPLVAA